MIAGMGAALVEKGIVADLRLDTVATV